MTALIFKICRAAEWKAAVALDSYSGSAKDVEDGFLHFSTEEQLPGTLNRYYAGANDLMLVAVDGAVLGDALKYEASTAGALYPHLYAALPLAAVQWARPIGRNENGEFVMPL